MTQSPGALFERLLDIMRSLRRPSGCPWDREQTPTSLKPCLIEETYEVIEAIELPDRRYALGVLWHPEEDMESKVIGSLVAAAQEVTA